MPSRSTLKLPSGIDHAPPLTTPLTMADALRWVCETDLPDHQRKRLRSDLNSVNRLAGLAPGTLELTPEALRGTFLDKSAAGHGISLKRSRNILSSLRFVLRQLDAIDPADTPVSDAWNNLLCLLDTRKRAEVIGLARFCSLRGIEPVKVDTATFQKFEIQVTTRTLTPRPRKRIGSLRSFWNRASRTVPGWPATRIQGGRRHNYVLPLSAFTQAFRNDLVAFGERLTASGFDAQEAFSGSGISPTGKEAWYQEGGTRQAMKPVRAITRDMRIDHARWAASVALATGVPATDINSLRDLVTPPGRPKAIFRFLYDQTYGKRSAAGTHAADVLRIIARYHAGLRDDEVNEIIRLGNLVRLHYPGMTEKNQRRVRAASTPHADAVLLTLPEVLMAKADRLLETAPKQAVAIAMRGLALEILTKTPLRLGELIGLCLDRHLQRPDPKVRWIGYLSIPAHERKNGLDYTVPVSKETASHLDRWIRFFRPVLAAQDCTYLFPGVGTGNASITRQGMRDAIKQVTKQYIGVALCPHSFRHLAGHQYLERRPGHYGAVSRLLGHKDMTTAQRYYISKENEAAHREYDANILARKAIQRRPRDKIQRAGKRSSH